MKRSAATVEEHPKGSGKYRVRARIGGKLKTILSGVPQAEAEETADAYQDVKATSELREGVTLSAFGVGFLDRRERAGVRGIKRDRSRWNYVLKDEIGKLALSTIRRRDVLDWIDRLPCRGHQTRKNALNLLRVALQEAVDRELLELNPARDIKIHKAGAAKETDDLEGILTPAEQAALLAAVPTRSRPVVEFALYAGARQGSQWHLRAEDCNLADGTVFLRRHKSGRARTHHCLSPAIDAARRSLARGSKWAFPAPKGGRRADGKPPRGWHKWVDAAGIKRRIRWHDLRHTCATSLLAGWWGNRKWTLDEVCSYMGHSTVKITERYARKLAETQRLAVAETVFPGGSNGGRNTANPPQNVADCKTVIRRFESDPRLPINPADSESAGSESGELAGNIAEYSRPVNNGAAVWSLAFAAERVLGGAL